MDPLIASAAISAVGGLLGKSKAKYVAHPYEKIRRKAENAGYNPLLALNNSQGQVVQTTNPMGNAIARAASAYADQTLREEELEIDRGRLEMENRRLDEIIKVTKLTPNIGGIYSNGASSRGQSNNTGHQVAANVVGQNNSGNGVTGNSDPAFPVGNLATALDPNSKTTMGSNREAAPEPSSTNIMARHDL